MEDTPTGAGLQSDEDHLDDEEPAFVDPNEAVEVEVDEDAPMEEDEDDEDVDAVHEETRKNVIDMSRFKIEAHTGPVYGVSCHFDAASQKMTIVTGGGDDRAFLHKIHGAVPATLPMDHNHTDSVSAVALNLDYVSEDLTQTPKLAAVGAYDGGTIQECLSLFARA